MATIAPPQPPSGQQVTCDQALKIARGDAEKAYRDLSGYRITILLGPDGWHIDYELTKPLMAGGGPHYVIDATTGGDRLKTV